MRLALVLTAISLAGCASPEFHAHNLRELHEADGSARFVGRTMSPLGWATRQMGGFSLFGGGEGQPPRFIKDPYSLTLEHLNGLARGDARDPQTAGLQVQFFGWLAEQDEFTLARERAVLELEKAARRLGVHRALEPVPSESAATPDELERALGRIQDVAYYAISGEIAPDSAPGQLREACEAAGELVLDREGMRRMLDFTTILVGAERDGLAPFERGQLAPLFDLHTALQRDYVATSLHAALQDPHPLVVGAAVRSVYSLPGTDREALAKLALDHPAREVVTAGLAALRDHGLPPVPEGLAADQHALYQDLWLERLVILTRDLDGRVSAAACDTLEVVSRSGLSSLRPEVWRGWWLERQGREIRS